MGTLLAAGGPPAPLMASMHQLSTPLAKYGLPHIRNQQARDVSGEQDDFLARHARHSKTCIAEAAIRGDELEKD
jgi:hypothetical protein